MYSVIDYHLSAYRLDRYLCDESYQCSGTHPRYVNYLAYKIKRHSRGGNLLRSTLRSIATNKIYKISAHKGKELISSRKEVEFILRLRQEIQTIQTIFADERSLNSVNSFGNNYPNHPCGNSRVV